MTTKPKRNCANCGKLFTPKDARSLYCRDACRTSACRKRKKVEQTTTSTDNTAQTKTTKWENRTVTVEIRNPKYTDMEAVLTNAKAKVNQLKNEESQLRATKKEVEESSNPTDTDKYYKPAFIWGAPALIVGLCGSMIAPSKPNNDPETKQPETRFFVVFGLVLIAIIAGIIIAENQRQSKQRQFPEILKRLEELPKEIEQAERLVTRLSAELEAVPQTIEREKIESYAVAESVETVNEPIEEVQEPIQEP